jgi:hypothetical protein
VRHSRKSDISFVAVAHLRDRRAAATRHVVAAIRAQARADGATRAARLPRRGRALTGRYRNVAHKIHLQRGLTFSFNYFTIKNTPHFSTFYFQRLLSVPTPGILFPFLPKKKPYSITHRVKTSSENDTLQWNATFTALLLKTGSLIKNELCFELE